MAETMATIQRKTGDRSFEAVHESERQWETLQKGGNILCDQYRGPTTGSRPIRDGRFNVKERKKVSEVRLEI